MYVKYTQSGHLFIDPEDDCQKVVDVMLLTDYNEEFCVARDFSPGFIAKLMEAGFLVMSADLARFDEPEEGEKEPEPFYILLPKLHLVRSVLFFEDLHVKKSLRRLIKRYELRADAEFDRIIDRCVEKHGGEWLTPPLVESIKKIREDAEPSSPAEPASPAEPSEALVPKEAAYPASFGLYRDGKLVAGEFGVVYGGVYTSYSGFYEEDNAGTVQIILAARYLREHGFSFLDLGMPMDYKNALGAVDVSPAEFVRLFRGVGNRE
jgi:Leu/Phe-tRNA-protein transferase